MGLENTYSGYLWESAGREGAVLRGRALWYLRTQRLVVHFKRWQGGNMLSGWHCKCREFACLCAALPQDTEAEKSEVFSPVNPWNKMVLTEKYFFLAMRKQSSTHACYGGIVNILGSDLTLMKMQIVIQKTGNNVCMNFPLSGNVATPFQKFKFVEQCVCFLLRFMSALTECSMVSRGIRRTSRASSSNPNFISGSGIGRMWKSINIKRWSVEDKYISSWRKQSGFFLRRSISSVKRLWGKLFEVKPNRQLTSTLICRSEKNTPQHPG